MLRRLSEIYPQILPLIPDGCYGANTYASVRSFQEFSNLPVTGTADMQTWNFISALFEKIQRVSDRMLSDPFLSLAKKHAESADDPRLYVAQAMLLALSEKTVSVTAPQITGVMDTPTAQALSQIQKLAGLPSYHGLDPLTWYSLTDLYQAVLNM